MIATFHSQHFCVYNQIFEVLTDATLAELVIAGLKLVKLALWLALTTDLTCFIVTA